MSLKKKIIAYMKLTAGKAVNLKDLYSAFNEQKPSTIRGRINESVGTKFLRVGKGQYILIGDEVEAIIEQGDSKLAIPNILASLMYYDMVFFDIPYFCSGQKGGNRDLSTYNLIYPEEFEKIAINVQKMLRDENSQVYFLIAGGKYSKADALKYLNAFNFTDLKLAAKGSYTKLNVNNDLFTPTSKVCNMGQYNMPAEDIFVYSPSGELLKPDETILDFELERPPLPRSGGYPTQKPFKLLEQIIKQATNVGDFILDLFGGSGVTLDAALSLKRKCHIFDIANDSIRRMKEIVNKYTNQLTLKGCDYGQAHTYSVSQQQIFANGTLF